MLDRTLTKMPFKLTDVSYMPGLKENLFSTQVLMYNGTLNSHLISRYKFFRRSRDGRGKKIIAKGKDIRSSSGKRYRVSLLGGVNVPRNTGKTHGNEFVVVSFSYRSMAKRAREKKEKKRGSNTHFVGERTQNINVDNKLEKKRLGLHMGERKEKGRICDGVAFWGVKTTLKPE